MKQQKSIIKRVAANLVYKLANNLVDEMDNLDLTDIEKRKFAIKCLESVVQLIAQDIDANKKDFLKN